MKARPAKPKLNKMGQPENFGVEADSPGLYTVSHKPKVIVGGNKPKVSRPFYDVKKVFKTN